MDKKILKKIDHQQLFLNLRDLIDTHNLDDLLVILKPDISDSRLFKDYDQIKSMDVLKILKQYGTKIDRQLQIISLNIIDSFIHLPHLKFAAVMLRMKLWGFRLVILQFIINYYLFIKKDNRLKQFVMFHILRLIRIVIVMLQKQLVDDINAFNFLNRFTELNLRKLANKKQLNELKLANINIPNLLLVKLEKLKLYLPGSLEAVALLQLLIAQLKSEHPKLLELIL